MITNGELEAMRAVCDVAEEAMKLLVLMVFPDKDTPDHVVERLCNAVKRLQAVRAADTVPEVT